MPEFDYTDYGPKYKDIPGYPGYHVGTDGSVWSSRINRGVLPSSIGGKWKRLKTRARKSKRSGKSYQYQAVCLYADGKQKTWYVHKIVLTVFVGQQPTKDHLCCHFNNNETDNRPCNLRWGTSQDNADDRKRHGTLAVGSRHGSHTKPHRVCHGKDNGMFGRPEKCHRSRLSWKDAEEIRQMSSRGMRNPEIAKIKNIDVSQVSRIVCNKAWKMAMEDER